MKKKLEVNIHKTYHHQWQQIHSVLAPMLHSGSNSRNPWAIQLRSDQWDFSPGGTY